VVGEPFTVASEGGDHTVLAIGTAVFPHDTSGRIDAMLVVEIPIDELKKRIGIDTADADDVYVVDRHGRFLMSAHPREPALLTDLTGSAVVKEAVGDQPLLAGVLPRPAVREFGPDPFTGEPRPFATSVVNEIGWYALVVPTQAALESVDAVVGQLRTARVAIVLVLIIATFALATFLRQVTAQRARLAAANLALAEASELMASASRHKSEFLSNMSHELRTPLNAIIGFADVLGQRLAGDMNAKQSEYVSDIAGSGHHLLDLVNEILDLAKVEAGRMELENTEFDPTESIRTTLALVRERAAGHGIQIATEVPTDLGPVFADERKFRQILLNLLSNAVKFTPDGGWVGVVARRDGGELCVSVRDTGVGISSDDQARVFDEFQQVGRDPERSREGTGLGLTLAKRFVELHGGRIWVESEVGKGSTFTLAIPVRQTALADAKG
jgi:signal transduction histidine kinase